MGFDGLLVTEIFRSLQGETSLSGVPFIFIRLTGCNLRCTYCDTAYAFKGGTRMRIYEVMKKVAELVGSGESRAHHVLITGGEPLLQRQTPALVDALRAAGYRVSIETHGEAAISRVAGRARIIMDIKTPASGMSRGGYRENLALLKKDDEIKFVIASEEDYEFAKRLVSEGLPVREVLFSPALPARNAPGSFPGVSARWLAERILEDRLPVRMQLQLHKLIWGSDQQGV